MGDSPASEFSVLTFRNTLSVSSLIGGVNKKNNWDQTARVFTQVYAWLTRSLGQSEGRTGIGHVRVHEQPVEGEGPKWGPVVRQICTGETARLILSQALTCTKHLSNVVPHAVLVYTTYEDGTVFRNVDT